MSKRNASRAVRSLGLAAILLALAAVPASAEPVFGVSFERDMETVHRNDERLDYRIEIENASPGLPVVGEELECLRGTWGGNPAPHEYEYEWLRNGVAIAGSASGPTPSSQTSFSYTVQADDAGTVLQCVVTATNTTSGGISSSALSAPQVVDPLPSPAPPSGPVSSFNPPGRPVVPFGPPGEVFTRKVGALLTCIPPNSWSGSPTWTFQWLRNGQPIFNETGSTYTTQEADEGQVIQCQVIGANASGAARINSENLTVQIGGQKEVPFIDDLPGSFRPTAPTIPSQHGVKGPITVELELPGGAGTFVYRFHNGGDDSGGEPPAPEEWSCSAQPPAGAQPATATCTNPNTGDLEPGEALEGLGVATALGADAPDIATANLTVSGGGAETVQLEDSFAFAPPIPFGIAAFDAAARDEMGNDYVRAGGHPFSAASSFKFNWKRKLTNVNGSKFGMVERVRTINVDVPRGFIGNALAVPELCPSIEAVIEEPSGCPEGSVVGGITLETRGITPENLPIYSIVPEFGVPAQFAFGIVDIKTTYTFVPRLRADDGYAISLEASPVVVQPELLSVDAELCGFGAETRIAGTVTKFDGCKEAGDPDANEIALATMPTRCAGPPPVTTLRIDSWIKPKQYVSQDFVNAPIEECENVDFEPQISLKPTSSQADSPTGLDVELSMPTKGLEDPEGISQASLKRARIYFPEGMAINASAGQGLGSCSAEQVKLGTNDPISCPESSKVGTIEIDTPLIQETLTGYTYIAKQSDAPPGALIGLYMVFESAKDGIIVKIPGGVKPDPKTGQLIVTFDESPEQPFSRVAMHFPQGPRSSLLNPPKCGNYEVKAELVPWTIGDLNNPTAAETVTQTSTYQVNRGPGGGRCPRGDLEPKFNAGAADPTAGRTSPFLMRLHREDGTDRFTGLELKTPPGLTAYLKGIPYCPDEILAAIPTGLETGQGEIDRPSCPAASQVGTASAGAGAGPNPLYVDTGKAYLAGPYKGAPLSLALVTPAVAGPLDLGNVVVRTALHVDPVTAQISAVSDPIPTILHGLLLDIRDIRVAIDRPGFTLNPTNCEPLSVTAEVKGQRGGNASLSNRFQVDGCAALPFKPRIALRLKGGTKRADHPALTAVVRPRPGDANIGGAAVTLPRSAFLDQGHIRTICTRVQWAQDSCPKAAIYGRAAAVTPLLDQPLVGPVYLRSSDNKLPDLVADLRGPAHQPIKVEASFRTDSVRGGIRSTLNAAPDAPVTKFTLRMQGGKKGLIVNSRNLCTGPNRATARLSGQNGRRFNSRPKVVALNCKQRKRKSKSKKRRAKHAPQSNGSQRATR